MGKFNTGDRVKIVAENSGRYREHIGKVTTVTEASGGEYHLKGIPHTCGWWGENELSLMKGTSMSKFYRVSQDSPAWLEGAILEYDSENDTYGATSDLWDAFEKNYPSDYCERAEIVENNPKWFERVYEVKILGKAKYLTKEKAREAHNALYKDKKK